MDACDREHRRAMLEFMFERSDKPLDEWSMCDLIPFTIPDERQRVTDMCYGWRAVKEDAAVRCGFPVNANLRLLIPLLTYVERNQFESLMKTKRLLMAEIVQRITPFRAEMLEPRLAALKSSIDPRLFQGVEQGSDE